MVNKSARLSYGPTFQKTTMANLCIHKVNDVTLTPETVGSVGLSSSIILLGKVSNFGWSTPKGVLEDAIHLLPKPRFMVLLYNPEYKSMVT